MMMMMMMMMRRRRRRRGCEEKCVLSKTRDPHLGCWENVQTKAKQHKEMLPSLLPKFSKLLAGRARLMFESG